MATVTALVPRQSAELSTDRHDPRDDWPEEARNLADHLTEFYGDADPLPPIAGGWVARQKSRHTRRAYVRTFKAWEQYARKSKIHPLQAKLPLADAYAKHLAKTPTRNGRPPAETTQAQALAAAGSFYTYAARLQAVDTDPFAAVNRPYVDPDYSPTEGLTEAEMDRLIETAKQWAPRSYALVVLLYLTGARIDEILALGASQLGYDRGHRTLPLRQKGGKRRPAPVPPIALDALLAYLGERTDGPLFTTESGRRWSQPEVWKHLRVLARRAGIPQAASIKPHTLRHQFITDSLADPNTKLQDVQDAVSHSDPRTTQRYNRRRGLLDNHPAYALAARLGERLEKETS
ncbi:tyrosine-type recombinase/integrase [Streptomyces sp. BPPL-273]|uniref:tyrosine-type recombinase/integrase n=1 Tax=Streptomyces sp. BPPL-273 TaxID=2987533 RepID=UPI0024AFF3B4|nr:tyrosine-type recombinase/integrase [Streptomyces sp. BPPL-273]WHM30161.1 tyrosine-type recombinase/integrase [Streptomyces sp. BPPL-273]